MHSSHKGTRMLEILFSIQALPKLEIKKYSCRALKRSFEEPKTFLKISFFNLNIHLNRFLLYLGLLQALNVLSLIISHQEGHLAAYLTFCSPSTKLASF